VLAGALCIARRRPRPFVPPSWLTRPDDATFQRYYPSAAHSFLFLPDDERHSSQKPDGEP